MSEDSTTKPPRRRLLKAGLWCGMVLLVLIIGAGVAVMSMIGTRVAAPEWLRNQVTERVNTADTGVSLGFGDLSMVLQDDWVPKVALQNLVVRDAEGAPLVQLANVQGTLALGPLLRGELRPGSINVSGMRLLVRRSAEGDIDLQLGDESGDVQQTTDPASLVDQIDAFLQRPDFAALRNVTADNLTLRYEDARARQAWNVDGGRLEMIRDGDTLELDAELALLGDRGFATTLEMIYRSEIGSSAADFVMTFEDMPARDIAGQSAALSWLRALEAPISGGLSVEVDEDGNLGPLAANLDIAAGVLVPNDAAHPIAFEHAGADLSYNPDTAIIRFYELEIDSKWISTRIEGQTRLQGMEDGWPDALVSQFQATKFETNPMELYDAPIALEGATLDMRLRLDPFEITLGEMSVTDQGQHFRLAADVSADSDGWNVSASGLLPEIAPDRLLELWPQTLEPKTRTWITNNVKTAQLSNIQFGLSSVPGSKPDVFLGFDFDALETRFIRDVPHIEGGRGTASIQDNQFVISAHAGYVTAAEGGRIDIAGSSFDIPDIRIKRGPGVVRLRTDSTVTAALSLLNEEPFGFIDKAGQTVTVAEGHATMTGRLDFDVVDDLTPDDVKFTLVGRLTDVRSDKLVEGRVLAAAELEVDANSERLRLGGAGQVGEVPFEGFWNMPLVEGSNGRAKVTGWIELSETFLDEFQIGLPPGSLTGTGRGELEMDFERGTPPEFRLTSDLAGLSLSLPVLDWEIGANETGELAVSGTLGEPPSIDSLLISGGGLRAQGSVTLQPGGQLQQANFSRVQLDNWIDAPVDIVGLGPGQPPLIRVVGGTIDLREQSLAGQGNGPSVGGKGGPVSLRLDALQITDEISLTDFTSELDMSGGVKGTFTARVNGQSEVAGRIEPREGGSLFFVTAGNAGGVLRSANFMKQGRGGDFQLLLWPGEEPGTMEGKLDIESIRVKDAPAMAALLNAISLVGILEQLAGEGIHFAEVEAKFKLAPNLITLYSGSAVGASMGISMQGYYDPAIKWLDMDGVISPIYAINALGRIFARKGEGLLGFTYDIDGEVSNPKIEVDPFSILTPGLFREIYRKPPPELRDRDPSEIEQSEDADLETNNGQDR